MAMIKTSQKKANEDEEKDNYASIISSGFIQKEYNANIVPRKHLYHRCHLIGWDIGEIDIEKRNLMIGTLDSNVYIYKKGNCY